MSARECMPDSGSPPQKISPAPGREVLASSRAMVLLPLPLSPASATISCRPMARLTSSTACSVRRFRPPPIWKSRDSPSVRSSGSDPAPALAAVPPVTLAVGSVTLAPSVAFPQQAADLGAAYLVQLNLGGPAAGHDLRTARREPAAVGRPGQVRRAAGDAGQRDPRTADRRERLEQPGAVGMQRGVEDLAGGPELGDL